MAGKEARNPRIGRRKSAEGVTSRGCKGHSGTTLGRDALGCLYRIMLPSRFEKERPCLTRRRTEEIGPRRPQKRSRRICSDDVDVSDVVFVAVSAKTPTQSPASAGSLTKTTTARGITRAPCVSRRLLPTRLVTATHDDPYTIVGGMVTGKGRPGARPYRWMRTSRPRALTFHGGGFARRNTPDIVTHMHAVHIVLNTHIAPFTLPPLTRGTAIVNGSTTDATMAMLHSHFISRPVLPGRLRARPAVARRSGGDPRAPTSATTWTQTVEGLTMLGGSGLVAAIRGAPYRNVGAKTLTRIATMGVEIK